MTNNADKFVHLPKGGYILTAVDYQLGRDVTPPNDCLRRRELLLDWHENATGTMIMSTLSEEFDNPKDIKINKMSLDDFANLVSYVHGNIDQLKDGKLCVIRNIIEYVAEGCSGLGYTFPEVPKAVLHLTDGVILFLGITSNMNAKVVYKSKR